MYADQPDLSDLSAQQLVQLVLLAESYDVSKVVAAAAEAIAKLRPEQLTPEAISAVMVLPDSCLELDCFKEVKVKASDQLQRQFGDLEVVWGDSSKATELLELPYAAILQLVQDSRTKVACEDTIVYTLGRWLEQHPDTSSEQKQQLASTVRLLQCTATFLTSNEPVAWLLDAGCSEQELRTACVLQGRTKKQQTAWVSNFCSSRSAWNLQRRPLSDKWLRYELVWKVPLAELRSTFDEEPNDSGKRQLSQPDGSFIWHGREWEVYLEFSGDSNSIGVYVGTEGSRTAFECAVQASRTAGEALRFVIQAGLVGDGYSYGCPTFVPGPSGSRDWGALEASLRRQKLVHADGCLHLQAGISGVA
jgi:hypothetical protein